MYLHFHFTRAALNSMLKCFFTLTDDWHSKVCRSEGNLSLVACISICDVPALCCLPFFAGG